MECPICQGASRHLFSRHGYDILGCDLCGHRFADIAADPQHVEQVYSDGYFEGGEAGYSDYLGGGAILRASGKRYGHLLNRHLLNRHMSPGTILDVGAAAGFLLQGLLDTGWQGEGVEPNPRMAQHARETLGLSVHTGALEQFPHDQQFDVVSMIQVIAHFYDLRQALTTAAELTRPGGYWLIESWNKDSWTARLLGKNWHEYSPPSVLHWFSPKDLAQLAGQFGFHEVARGRPTRWIKGHHAKSLLDYKLQEAGPLKYFRPFLKLVPGSISYPYPSEDLFWVLYQKQT